MRDVLSNGKRFKELGEDLERECGGVVGKGMVGGAIARLSSVRDGSRFAEGWLPVHRPVGST